MRLTDIITALTNVLYNKTKDLKERMKSKCVQSNNAPILSYVQMHHTLITNYISTAQRSVADIIALSEENLAAIDVEFHLIQVRYDTVSKGMFFQIHFPHNPII